MSDEVQEYWKAFLRTRPDLALDTPYTAWYFGDHRKLADELAELVKSGKKTATTSLYWEFEAGQEVLPRVGDFSVITDFDGQPQCIIQTSEVRRMSFDEVDAQFAADEGEGDRSLEYWREGHWRYFGRACRQLGREPDLKMPVVCERFRKVYP